MRHTFTALLGAMLLFAPITHAEDVPHPGPRSPEEETFLYKSATEALSNQKNKDAIRDFERLIDRYPATKHLHEAYFALLSALLTEREFKDLEKYSRQAMSLKLDKDEERKAKVYLAHALFARKQYFEARTLAEEVLKSDPPAHEKGLAQAVQFLGYLEDKEYEEAKDTLDELEETLEENDIPAIKARIPEFKMIYGIRSCMVSRLLAHKKFTEEEIQEYVKDKNLCIKEAWVFAPQVKNEGVINEWCTSLNSLTKELKKIQMDSFLREKLNKDLNTTRENTNCHEPKDPKVQKHHRKRNVRKPRSR